MRDPHGRIGGVDALSARARRAEDVDANLVLPHVDLHVVDLGNDGDRSEAGLPSPGGVERRDAHQAVHAGLAAQEAVSVLAGDLDRHRLDPGLLPRQQIDDLGLEAVALAPPEVHAHEHLGPVLGLGAAGAGVDAEDGRLAVVRTREHDLELELVELLPEPGYAVGDLGVQAAVVGLLGQLEHDPEVLGLAAELAEPRDNRRAQELIRERAELTRVVTRARESAPGPGGCPPRTRARPFPCRSRPAAAPWRRCQRCLRRSSTRRVSSATAPFSSPAITAASPALPRPAPRPRPAAPDTRTNHRDGCRASRAYAGETDRTDF